MVGAEDVGMDCSTYKAWTQAVGAKEVVNAPPCVPCTGTTTIAPPAVCTFKSWKEVAERVCEACVEENCHLLALFVREASIAAVRGGILEVYLLVGNIHVATHDNRLTGIQCLQVCAKVLLPLHTVVKAAQTVLGVGSIYADKVHVLEFQSDNTPFVVVLLDTNAEVYAEGFYARKNGCATIALFLSIVPVTFVTRKRYVELSGLHLRLLKAENIGIQTGENVAETLSVAGTEAVNIP